MENGRIANRIYVGEFEGDRLVGRPQKMCIDSVNDCLKKRGLNVGQTRRMGREGGRKGECLGHLTRCYSCGLSQIYETLKGGGFSVAKPTT